MDTTIVEMKNTYYAVVETIEGGEHEIHIHQGDDAEVIRKQAIEGWAMVVADSEGKMVVKVLASNLPPEEEKDICPFCKENEVEIDDFGLVCCRRCFNEHPEWQRKMSQQQADIDFETGRPMSESD